LPPSVDNTYPTGCCCCSWWWWWWWWWWQWWMYIRKISYSI